LKQGGIHNAGGGQAGPNTTRRKRGEKRGIGRLLFIGGATERQGVGEGAQEISPTSYSISRKKKNWGKDRKRQGKGLASRGHGGDKRTKNRKERAKRIKGRRTQATKVPDLVWKQRNSQTAGGYQGGGNAQAIQEKRTSGKRNLGLLQRQEGSGEKGACGRSNQSGVNTSALSNHHGKRSRTDSAMRRAQCWSGEIKKDVPQCGGMDDTKMARVAGVRWEETEVNRDRGG